MKPGLLKRPAVFRSQTCDKLDPSGFFIEYARFSDSIFANCSIHDIDLALWFFGGKIARLFCSRMMAADSTEITGTEGKLAINTQPISNLGQYT